MHELPDLACPDRVVLFYRDYKMLVNELHTSLMSDDCFLLLSQFLRNKSIER